MKRYRTSWSQQNEEYEPDSPGVYLRNDQASFTAEMSQLKEWGCPDTEHAELVEHIVNDRNDATIVANVTEPMLNWLYDQELVEADDDAS